ncbi:alpha-ketoglutarate-dependent dioxygenase AlkB [Nostoc sp. FACHB-973]|nr:alpha-ketoglutarate-dependent dioxygenase AlkB [Nostoc sp. FACHB-973]
MYNQISIWDYLPDTNSLALEDQLHKKSIINTDGEVIFYPNFFTIQESNHFFSDLYSSVNWKQDTIKLFGKKMPLPRLTAWYGDEGKSYTYSGIVQYPEPWNPVLKSIKSKIEKIAEVSFNSVLLNLYRDGKDSVSWHSDDEPELGENPIIGSVSFGATRRFSLRHKQSKDYKIDVDLGNGSFLLMKGGTQHFWQHQIAKTPKSIQPRINLTFRIIQ